MKHPMGVRFAVVALASFVFSLPAFADSQIRIVRLSDVQGDVRIDRNTNQGFERAFLNLPVTQGTKLHTGNDGFAEVEFEDGTTLRIAPGTAVEFPELALRDSGAKASTVSVRYGTAYVSFVGTKDDQFTLAFADEKVALSRPVHLRLEMGHTKAALAVLKGDVQVEDASGLVEVGKMHTFILDRTQPAEHTVAHNAEDSPYDSWDQDQIAYRQRYAMKNTLASSAFGGTDLNYYGNYFNAPGYGMMWQPYFAGVGWDPFMSGTWAFYPGNGYSWISSYPWGWAPFHSGSWAFVPSYGWAWQPGGTFMGLANIPKPINTPRGFVALQPPAESSRSLVVVNRSPVALAATSSSGKMVIRNDSAGLGIYRGSIPNLGKVSQRVEQRGAVTATVQRPPASAMFNSMAMRGGTSAGRSAAQGAVARSAAAQSSSRASYGGGSAVSSGSSHASGSAPSSGGVSGGGRR